MKIAADFDLLLLAWNRDWEKVLISLFFSSYKVCIWADWIKDFRNRKIKILVYINMAKIKSNISNFIEKIQWKLLN